MRKLKAWLTAVMFVGFLAGCGGGSNAPAPDPAPSDASKTIATYSFAGASGTIDEVAKTIAVTMPSGTNVTALVATFSTTGAGVKVGATAQTSGTTANDFTNPVVYTVTAADGSTASYTVTVTVALSSAKAITAYSLGTGSGIINEAAKTIAVNLPNGTNVTAMVATFSTTGVGVKVGATAQATGATLNDFTNPVIYTVTAEDSSTASYTVTVTVASSSAKAITAFSLAGVPGTVNEAAKTIAVTMPNGTNMTALVATFSTTGASVKVGATVQTSATTVNNFTNPVVYTVTAADATTVAYTVTVTLASTAATLPRTGRNTSSTAGEDGDLQKGVAWPSPRFTTNADTTVTDNLTGLAWTPDGNGPGPCSGGGATRTWTNSFAYISCLNASNYLGHSDWRLPNVNELSSLLNAQESDTAAWLNTQGFSNVQQQYWSSTKAIPYGPYAWLVQFGVGEVNRSETDPNLFPSGAAWAVRGQSGGAVNLPRTGQALCYDEVISTIACAGTGQDGELQIGAAWPNSRFTTNADTTVTDNLTRLVWSADANAPGPAGCGTAVTKVWLDAIYYVNCLNSNNYLGHADWRLPNRNELRSLVNYGQTNPDTWLNTQGFSNVAHGTYWSSTRSAAYGEMFSVYMPTGVMQSTLNGYYYVWPVRTGQ